MTDIDTRLLLLATEDNVIVTRTQLAVGEVIDIDGDAVAVSVEVPLGFKIARCDLHSGDKILKYGAVIGSATADIRRGEIVHLHNMKSDYLPTYTHEAGLGFTKRNV